MYKIFKVFLQSFVWNKGKKKVVKIYHDKTKKQKFSSSNDVVNFSKKYKI